MAVNDGCDFNESINIIFEKLEKFLTTKMVVGEPIKVGETTIIPVIGLSFGMGSGASSGDDSKKNKGIGGGGAGVGARISPVAIVVITADKNVELLTMKRIGGLDKLMEMVPEIITKISDVTKKEKDGQTAG
jgi:uncharacterized spore protein YtfJ